MATVDKEKQTWREQRIEIPAQEQTVVYFNDTTPNHILISNSSGASIFAGTNGNVSQTSYDTVIQPYGTRLLPSMLPFNRLYVYNSGAEATTITVKSWQGEFNAAAIAQSVEMVGAGQNGLLGIVDVNYILSPLPAGNNLIGGVQVTGFEQPLPTGNNKIGSMDINEMPNHAATYLKVDGKTDEIKSVKITAGVVYKIVGDVTLYDDAAQAWATGDFDSPTGLQCTKNIKLKFATDGTAFILFK